MFSKDSDARYEFLPPLELNHPLQTDDEAGAKPQKGVAKRAAAKNEPKAETKAKEAPKKAKKAKEEPKAKKAKEEPKAKEEAEIEDDIVPDSPTTYELMRVVSVDDGWALMVDDVDEPAWVVSTKKKAVKAAKDVAQDKGSELVIHTASGKVQKRFDFSE